ncbi:MAG: GNAT family N-acetyltransferase, partial [Chitinophagia bacterium]|nr:GNAT family N-acetyltransferase [Chitinophagia bacterium]
MSLNIVRTTANNLHFRALVQALDADLAQRDGDDHPFFAQFNGLTEIHHVIVAYNGHLAVGCGAIKEYA